MMACLCPGECPQLRNIRHNGVKIARYRFRILLDLYRDPLKNNILTPIHFCKGAKMCYKSFRVGLLRRNGSD